MLRIQRIVKLRVEFVEAPAFTRHVHEYLSDDEYAALQQFLAINPEAGAVMPGTGGIRKLRWGDERRGKGRRGGLRVIYYFLIRDQQVWLFTLFGKDEAADLTASQKRQLRAAIETELRAREGARQHGRRRG
jgi:mRNA-degrading endonuclease RelE of RelBE toxin-antitoxin system